MTEQMNEQEWTPLQEAYLQKLMATYQANLHFFHQRFPEVFEKLMAVQLPAPFKVGPDGETTIYSGRYQGGPGEFVELEKMLYQHFDDIERRPRIKVSTEFIDDPRSAAPHANDPTFYRHTEPRFRFELIERFLSDTNTPGERLGIPEFGEGKLPIAIVFGSGYGWHLSKLVDEHEIRHLLIVDTDIERLNLSLYFVDYVSLFQRFAKRGFYFSVAFEEDPDKLANDLRSVLYHMWPPYFIQGAGLFFHDYDSDRVKKLWNNLKRDMWTLYRGWGFLDDEVLGLKHAVENSVDRIPLYTRKPEIPEDAVAFVIGSGPSLDGLLPILREHGDKAVIFSCGSAITALARQGIKPDFHVEVERTQGTEEMLLENVTRDFVRGVPIVALNIMHPGVFRLTDKPLMMLKELDLGAYIADFFGDLQRFRSNPTCTNGGVDLPLRMGFKKIYLFGIDYGFREAGPHHSVSTVYYDEEVDATDELARLVRIGHESNRQGRPVPANFGGEVLSTDIFIHSRDALELSIAEFSDAKVFNLNDGAAIKGVEPLQPDEFSAAGFPNSKAPAVEQALSAFTDDYDRDPFERLDFLTQQIAAVHEDLTKLFNRPIASKMDACDLLFDMHHFLFDPKHQTAQVFPLFRGSMLHLGRFFYDCLALYKDEQKAVEFAKFGFDLMLRFVDAGRETVASLHDVGQHRLQARTQAQ